ncbi:MAG: lipid II flippase MurJ [Candidatus Peregrinibacteria bacterium]|nr:lipid II flippase MurJ [Candidatus Peregrinibacteria bacterium]MDZ4244498.1 lipid II flippase MurJ [Candidatus Gracilibacteria bacterium]
MNSFINKIFRKREEVGGFKNLLLHTAFALTLTSGLSYFLGLVRDRAFAHTFGASAALDVYNAAFVVPDFFLALLVTSGLSAAFVPIFSGLDESKKKEAVVYTNQVLSYGLLLLVFILIIFAISLPYITEYLVPGFDEVKTAEYIKVTRLMLLSPILFTISNTFGNVLISIKEFFWFGLAPVMYNLGIVMGVYFIVPQFGMMGLVIGTIIGAFLHLAIRLPLVLKYGFRFRFNLKFDGRMKETAVLMIPKMFQMGMWQVLLWWFVNLASRLPEGSVTIYSFARNFQSVPVSLIGIAIALSAFARLSHIAAKKDYKEFKSVVWKKGLYILGVTAVAAVALGVVSNFVIGMFLGGGKFDEAAVSATAALLIIYCISIPLESLMHLLARAHYALKNTLRPSSIHVFTILLTMFASYFLLPKIGLFAIPTGFAIGLVVQITLLGFSLYQLLEATTFLSRLKSFLHLRS